MYSNYHLDTPPSQSQFRRPWSPEPFDPYSLSSTSNEHQPSIQQQRREASDVSIEALDLADYAMTSNPSGNENRYLPFRGLDSYPSSPQIHPPTNRTSLQTLSLVSGGGTVSLGHSSSSRSPLHRPFSLPLPVRSRASFPDDLSNHPYLASPPSVHSTQASGAVGSEIDISQFPAWSRNWYNSKSQSTPPSPYDDGLSPSHHGNAGNLAKVSPFDPGFSYPNPESYSHSYKHPMSDESSRDLLPWSGDPPSYGPPVDAEVKEERLRMLQREFGSKTNNRTGGEEEPVIGGVDQKGNLVTQGPKKRAVVRIAEGLLAFGSGASAIYAAVIIKPKSAPPPSGKLPAYVLYILSVITFLTMIYLFLFRPCCSSCRSPKSNLTGGIPGMMVLPIQQGKGKKWNGGKKGKKGMGGPEGNVQVNLIVDPDMLRSQQDDRHADEYDGEFEEHSPYSPYARENYPSPTPQRRTRPRRSVFAGLAMEEQWRIARSLLKKVMFFDIVFVALWGAEFVMILLGKRCPSGGFEGWCNAYNIASAGACLLFIGFGTSIFFDVKDLHASKSSPRTRP